MWNHVDLIEIVEYFADSEGWISSEEELSERFDDMLAECYPDFPTDDEPAITEFFNNWTDSLCQEGEIHPEQYSKYEYVGKYS